MPTVYAPSASIANYTLLPYTIDSGNSIDTILAHIEYSFTRKQTWVTLVQKYADRQFELMPQQIVKLNEFTIVKETWEPSEIALLETFIDLNKGSAYPFFFTAPDDGQAYKVRFKDDLVEYSVPSAVHRTGTLVLIEIGDWDGSLNNDLVYPSYVEPTHIALAGSITASGSPQTVSVNTSARLFSGMQVIVGLGVQTNPPNGQETVTLTGVPSGTQITAVFTNNHSTNEVIVAA